MGRQIVPSEQILTTYTEASSLSCIAIASDRLMVPLQQVVSFADLWPSLELEGHDFAVYAAEFGASTS